MRLTPPFALCSEDAVSCVQPRRDCSTVWLGDRSRDYQLLSILERKTVSVHILFQNTHLCHLHRAVSFTELQGWDKLLASASPCPPSTHALSKRGSSSYNPTAVVYNGKSKTISDTMQSCWFLGGFSFCFLMLTVNNSNCVTFLLLNYFFWKSLYKQHYWFRYNQYVSCSWYIQCFYIVFHKENWFRCQHRWDKKGGGEGRYIHWVLLLWA